MHYGIAWTPSAIEQRTGRVDRIGGLVQRRLDGSREPPETDDLIQVHYPHLRDTVELLQVRRVLRRLNKFLHLIHRGDSAVEADGQGIDANRAWHEELEDLPPIEGPLESAFPIEPRWLEGELHADDITAPDWDKQLRHLEALWQALCERQPILESDSSAGYVHSGVLCGVPAKLTGVREGNTEASSKMQPFTLGLRSQITGDKTLIVCESTIGTVDLQDDAVVDALMGALEGSGTVKFCVDPRVGKHQDRIFVRRELLFDPDATELADVLAIFENTLFPRYPTPRRPRRHEPIGHQR